MPTYTGKERSLNVTITIFGDPDIIVYRDGKEAFLTFPAITEQDMITMSSVDFQNRADAFYTYLMNEYPGLVLPDDIEPGFEPERDNAECAEETTAEETTAEETTLEPEIGDCYYIVIPNDVLFQGTYMLQITRKAPNEEISTDFYYYFDDTAEYEDSFATNLCSTITPTFIYNTDDGYVEIPQITITQLGLCEEDTECTSPTTEPETTTECLECPESRWAKLGNFVATICNEPFSIVHMAHGLEIGPGVKVYYDVDLLNPITDKFFITDYLSIIHEIGIDGTIGSDVGLSCLEYITED